MSYSRPNSTSGSRRLTDRQTAGLLGLCVTRSRRPVDRLIDRLQEPDGQDWWRHAIDSICSSLSGLGPEDLLSGRTTVADLTSLVRACSEEAMTTKGAESQLRFTAGYFAAVAAGLAHHQKLISGRSRNEMEPALHELAELTPEPWAALFLQAAARRISADDDRNAPS